MNNKVVLVLSRKQVVLLIWIIDSMLDLCSSLDKIFDINYRELSVFSDFIHSNFK